MHEDSLYDSDRLNINVVVQPVYIDVSNRIRWARMTGIVLFRAFSLLSGISGTFSRQLAKYFLFTESYKRVLCRVTSKEEKNVECNLTIYGTKILKFHSLSLSHHPLHCIDKSHIDKRFIITGESK